MRISILRFTVSLKSAFPLSIHHCLYPHTPLHNIRVCSSDQGVPRRREAHARHSIRMSSEVLERSLIVINHLLTMLQSVSSRLYQSNQMHSPCSHQCSFVPVDLITRVNQSNHMHLHHNHERSPVFISLKCNALTLNHQHSFVSIEFKCHALTSDHHRSPVSFDQMSCTHNAPNNILSSPSI